MQPIFKSTAVAAETCSKVATPMHVENTELPLCGAAPAFNLHFLPCLPQLFSFKNTGLQEPPSHQRVARKTLHEFLMKCDMPDKAGPLEACYFEVFSSAALPFNKSCLFTRDDEIKSRVLHLARLQKSESHIFWPQFVIINT